MTYEKFREICELDNIAEEAGGFVAYNPNFKNEPHYDYRAILAYCEKRNIEPIDMTIREMQQFVVS